ncbi:MAG: sigma 54-interacting transcriptional regulator [Sphaerochaetaceae bacterium]
MTNILIIVPYKEIYETIEHQLSLYDLSGMNIQLTHLYGTDDKTLGSISADIVVARGVTYTALVNLKPDIHIVPILPGPNDLLEALYSTFSYPEGNIGVLSGSSDMCDTAHVSKMMNRKVMMYVANDQEEVIKGVESLREQGCSVFLGGLTMCRYCEQEGYQYIHIKSGIHSINRSIHEAITTARSLERTKVRMKILETLLNNSKEAMVAVNKKGIVVVANQMAEQLFSAPLVNNRISDYYESDFWADTMKTGREGEVIEKISGMQILISSQPIMTGSEGLGVLLTFQNIETIRLVERKIRKELSKKGLVARYTFSNIISVNQEMKAIEEKARRYSKVNGALLLIGETGTGKELFAQSIHNASNRCGEPFVAVNCAALPESLLESELFGYSEGAFSGASKGGKQGLFELAHKGTLFLDEIGEMPIKLQAKLLRVLQEKEVRKVGGDTVVPVDVRIISATNVNISKKVKMGEFRLDLFYRISLLNLRLIPLWKRKEDIPLLFNHFVSSYCKSHNTEVPTILPEAYRALSGYHWPGNVRELKNSAERLAILLNTDVVGRRQIEELDIEATSLDEPYEDVKKKTKKAPDDEMLYREYVESGLSKEDFARSMNISRTTLWRKISRFEK